MGRCGPWGERIEPGETGKKEEPVILINGKEVDMNANIEQIKHFIRTLDLNMKIDMHNFLKKTNVPKFKLWIELLSQEIQRMDTESRFPMTRDEAISIILKIMRAYDQLPAHEREILWELFKTKEVQITLRDLDLNIIKIIALNKALHDVDSADGAVELLKCMIKCEDDRKELVFTGINFILKNGIGNPEAVFRVLKLIGENTKLIENEKQTISKFLNLLDPDFLLIKMGEVPNREIKKLITEKLYYAVSELGWVPKDERVRAIFEKRGVIRRK
ncbi:MAG: hypothetical protein ACP5JC_04585 [Candidatus Micrarchaeia archaeon]